MTTQQFERGYRSAGLQFAINPERIIKKRYLAEGSLAIHQLYRASFLGP
jgi:hypothetical protein